MNKKYYLPFIFLIILSLLTLLFSNFNRNKNLRNISSDNMLLHFIDVGQGDSILVQVNNKNMLIDAGPADSRENLLDYLSLLNINNLDYVIATHPHEDHIGNMAYIIDKYNVLNFYAPKITNNTKSFETMVEALVRKDLKINVIKAGIRSISLGKNTKVEVFSPSSDNYENINNYSPIIKISHGNNSFLLTGDAEELIEKEVINSNYNLKSDLLKIGHHGSSSSTSKEFFYKVNPSITVISVGKNNSYGHPTKKVLETIKNSKILRTDQKGTILILSDGKSLKMIDAPKI
ncbi:ComEC/Rec2 family competence protein [Caproiciproducens sp. MSJ-32]|uniref:ComEC/Rec2 family competence protein n=1 Tax=Caproiciproducens sp. MSJ-32 TaxID=2841527 RepID=UPI001C113053|nr:MBL fold metallo-hydrolase [Caproiciproducens sp. MSJ-32]MBU5455095.1 MBL fold metallo-hydrolase [Caproiciproducens sp. MSJ-32]